MTAAFDYEDMHHMVDRLSPTRVRRLRLLVTQDEELSQVAQSLSAVDAVSDVSFSVVKPAHVPALTLLP